MGYQAEYTASISNPQQFWAEKARAISWFKPPTQILSENPTQPNWFGDAELNTCYLALDHHVEQGRGKQTALIYDSPVTGQVTSYSYEELTRQVATFAGALKDMGVTKGDRVVIYMPMIPEAVIAMLATARLGAIHSVVFGGFAAHELALRIDDAQPKVVLSASCGLECEKVIPYKPLLDQAIEEAKYKPQHCVIYQRPQANAELVAGRDLDWQQLAQQAEPTACVSVQGSDPLYILYTSGTTGKPKGVVRDNGGHAVAMKYSMSAVYDMQPGDVFWAASDVGWVVGHSYIVYGPLISGCTTLLYEGKPVRTPDAGAFWRVCEQHQVKTLFAAPTAFRAIKKEDPNATLLKHYDLSHLQHIFMAGERLDPATYDWTVSHTNKPVIDHWWQTETGWAICANLTGIENLPAKPGSATVAVPGFEVQILNEENQVEAENKQGAIAIKLPLPPGCLMDIWNNSQRFAAGYLSRYPGFYTSGDGGYKDEDGYLYIMGRTDDVINVAGHRMSTGEMEEIIANHHSVAECAVIGARDPLKGQQPIGFVLLKNNQQLAPQQLQDELVAMIRQEIGAIACFKQVVQLQSLPKTRSGKILRKLMRQVVDGEDFSLPSTIDDPDSIEHLQQQVRYLQLMD